MKDSINIKKLLPDLSKLQEISAKALFSVRGAYDFIINKLSFTQESGLLIMGAITGILCGFGAVIFDASIDLVYDIFFVLPAHIFGHESILDLRFTWYTFYIVLIPALGGLMVGLLNRYFERGRKGEGIPTVIQAVAANGGYIKWNVSILKIIQAGLSIGTGGAGGKEGPIVQIGSAIGSAFGQILKVPQDKLKILVGCGAAAGLSAAFNAPLGGALFSMEIILRTFNAKSFSPIIIASVFGTVISRTFIGDEPAFQVPKYQLNSTYELFFYLILGVLAAFVSIYFIRVFLWIDEKFDGIKKIPKYILPMIGGLGVGIIGLFFPDIYGYSYSLIDRSLYNTEALWVLVMMIFLKPVATALTIGSGGNGGTFAPSLFTGAMLGGAFGQLINIIFPSLQVSPGAYALVGMAGVVAGTTNASLTALIMVFEITNNYKIILPLMLTIIIANVISRTYIKGSLYTLKFDKEGKGIDIYGRKTSLLKIMPVRGMIEPGDVLINLHDQYDTIVEKLKQARFETVLVKNEYGQICGKISFEDIRSTLLDKDTAAIKEFLIASDFYTKEVIRIFDIADCEEALRKMENYYLDYLPVYSAEGREYIGIITRNKILRNYQNELYLRENSSDLAIG